jgi:hypothetical protein
LPRLTTKINGLWDFNSEVGDPLEHRGGIVCDNCGEIVKLAYIPETGSKPRCSKCYEGDKDTALAVSFG